VYSRKDDAPGHPARGLTQGESEELMGSIYKIGYGYKTDEKYVEKWG
jgi:hypothetical protein